MSANDPPRLGVLSDKAIKMVGPAVRANVTIRKRRRRERWDVLFQVVGMYENSMSVAKIMMRVATAPPRAVADHVIAAEWVPLTA
jgi:hypothetical protein